MPSFDIVSELNPHEVANAIDQANREVSTRFDFKGTNAKYELAEYVITLSGHAELVLSGGQTIQVGPGSIELAEDLTGKGHITRTVGTEDRVAILIPVSNP